MIQFQTALHFRVERKGKLRRQRIVPWQEFSSLRSLSDIYTAFKSSGVQGGSQCRPSLSFLIKKKPTWQRRTRALIPFAKTVWFSKEKLSTCSQTTGVGISLPATLYLGKAQRTRKTLRLMTNYPKQPARFLATVILRLVDSRHFELLPAAAQADLLSP